MRLLVILGIIVAVVVCSFIFYQSSAFTITDVRVIGAERLTNSYLERAAAVPAGSTLLRVDAGGIEQRLAADPWVSSAKVERQFPSTLVLSISERSVAAVVEFQPSITSSEAVFWLISADGMWLGMVDDPDSGVYFPKEERSQYPRIFNVQRAVHPQFGAMNTDEGIRNALAVLKGFSPEMHSLVVSISAPDKGKTTLSLRNNVTVIFGAAEDIEAKETAIKTLLNEHPDTLISINVRVANRPTYSSFEQ